jgi:hypothetical protein
VILWHRRGDGHHPNGGNPIFDARSLERVNALKAVCFAIVDVELDPAQPPAIEAVVAAALDASGPRPDPWWQAGLDEALASEPPGT